MREDAPVAAGPDTVVFAEDALAPGAAGLWAAALDHVARRYAAIRELDLSALSADRDEAAAALDAWAGADAASWRRELARFYDDHAQVHLRRDPSTGALLAALRGRGTRLGAYGSGPREASAAVFAFLGLDRRLDALALEPAGGGLTAACALLGCAPSDAVHVRTRSEALALV
jgi:phosphoglycolate phosphatase-like HAD superfamily hydrolase